MLTGRPVFSGVSRATLLEQAQTGDLSDAFARLDANGADVQLVALAKQCLAANSASRRSR